MISNDLLKKVILEKAISGQLIKNNNGSWKEELLGNIGDWKAGSTPSKDKNEYHIDGTIPWLLTGDLNDGDIYSVNHYITDLAYKECSLRLNPINSVLIAMYGATIGKVAINKIETTTNQACCVCICDEKKIYYKYLFYYLIAIRDNLKSKAEGAGQPNISKQKICNTKIMLPSLEEQYMIVEKIEEIFELIDKKEKNDIEKEKLKIILKDKLLDSAIHGTVVSNNLESVPINISSKINNKPFEIPSNWKWCLLGDITDYGKNKKKNGKDIFDNEWILELEDIEKETGIILKKIYQKDRNAVSDKNIFKAGDVLYGKLRPYLNKCVIPTEDGYCSTEIEPMTPIDSVDSKYLQIVLMSKYFINYVNSCSYGAKMPRLGTKDGQNALIPVPPLEEQKRIVEKIEQCFELIEQL